jgi:hypothetical protein
VWSNPTQRVSAGRNHIQAVTINLNRIHAVTANLFNGLLKRYVLQTRTT